MIINTSRDFRYVRNKKSIIQMINSYHIYFKDELLFKDLNKDDFEFVWNKLYTSYINAIDDNLTYELITENKSKSSFNTIEPSY